MGGRKNKNRMRKFSLLLIMAVLLAGCKQNAGPADKERFTKNLLPKWNRELTSIIMGDVLSPPVCSRVYAYANVAAYEALLPESKAYETFAGRLKGLTDSPKPDPAKKYDYKIASIIAFLAVADKLVFNKQAVADKKTAFIKQLDSAGFEKEIINNSISYGNSVAQHIAAWINKDGYLQRTSFGGYNVTKEKGRWAPTPPDYTDATENNWKTLRPMTMDSCAQFRPGPPVPYDTAKTSAFYQEAEKVYKESMAPAPGDSAIAWYWDDNPNTSVTDGHITYFLQKISPPGHWIYIACSVVEKENYEAVRSAHTIAQTAIALYDAFMACWEAKYHYNYLRPITFINAHPDFVRPATYISSQIADDWQPLIQTPPFPEYPGGHGCISASAAVVLTGLVGDNYRFTDSTEVPFGRPRRTFNSFLEAAAQANISRFYGGIHFPNSLKVGAAMGKEIGNHVLQKLH